MNLHHCFISVASRLFCFLLLSGFVACNAQVFTWANRAGSTNYDYGDEGLAIAANSTDGCYVTGSFTDTGTFGATNLVSAGGKDIFVAKYSSSGLLLWVWQAGGPGDDVGKGIGVDDLGNCYVTGGFWGSATFGLTNLVSAGEGDVFVAKFDRNGFLQWVQRAGGSMNYDRGNGISVDRLGNSYFTGYFVGPATFGSTNITSAAVSQDVFLAKLNPAGDLQWVRRGGGSSTDVGVGVATDSSGGSYLTGYFYGNANFDGITLTNTSIVGQDVFVLKYNSQGVLQWARSAGGPLDDYGKSVASDGAGNCFVTGYFSQSIQFGTNWIRSTIGSMDIFLAKYDPSGEVLWARQAGGGNGVAVDAMGNCYTTGNYVSGTISGEGSGIDDILFRFSRSVSFSELS